jgi:hypothetical protein
MKRWQCAIVPGFINQTLAIDPQRQLTARGVTSTEALIFGGTRAGFATIEPVSVDNK